MNDISKRAVGLLAVALALTVPLSACERTAPIRAQDVPEASLLGDASTDKARYAPGETVRYTMKLNGDAPSGKLVVRYKQLDRVVGETKMPVKGAKELVWEWKPPADDYTGYMTEIFLERDGHLADRRTIAVDVSSDWGKFPRYGYLADFMSMERANREAVIDRLNRYHLNGLQFYDWQWKHHDPVKTDEAGQPAAAWSDIAGREVSLATMRDYIALAHGKNMKAMNYNLLFGAYEDAERDGVKREWGLFKDPTGETQDRHPLPDGWASDILLMDPSNPDWQQYLIAKERKAFELLPFDGWHVDQLGDRGARWTATGKSVNLAATYAPFLQAAKQGLDVDYVMNAVGQFAQPYIAKQAPVKFLYTEVWESHPQYKNLKQIVDQNRKLSDGKLNTVLAAYMNYDLSDRKGEFNRPGVLLADAVIFASGASHLELGENMLSKEYFPHRNLSVTPALERDLIAFYDFLTGYQNLLRDGAEDAEVDVTDDSGTALSREAEAGKIWTFAKRKDDRVMLHLINFADAKGMNWNDAKGTQAEPTVKENVRLAVRTDRKVGKVWMATPDYYGGSAVELGFKQEGGSLRLTLPKLRYWDMVVIEYKGS
ncbi:glycoside hydrolase family 66 protein [Cohnella nanjingensis]|uniref:Glycoside hydrolase family 66 protein n=1 Tax=Cohnella nanjingensis TaxID=1387779 RepID=A0A7X0RPT1_9BACL|nr:glycoside hydrolase family 66 protein [Cohnella nanjingensis]MBB6671330.1 glycoside hydrolase family 66 protein [Cohnella nanjingensis]